MTWGQAEGNRPQGTGVTAQEAVAEALSPDRRRRRFYPEALLVEDVTDIRKGELKK